MSKNLNLSKPKFEFGQQIFFIEEQPIYERTVCSSCGDEKLIKMGYKYDVIIDKEYFISGIFYDFDQEKYQYDVACFCDDWADTEWIDNNKDFNEEDLFATLEEAQIECNWRNSIKA